MQFHFTPPNNPFYDTLSFSEAVGSYAENRKIITIRKVFQVLSVDGTPHPPKIIQVKTFLRDNSFNMPSAVKRVMNPPPENMHK